MSGSAINGRTSTGRCDRAIAEEFFLTLLILMGKSMDVMKCFFRRGLDGLGWKRASLDISFEVETPTSFPEPQGQPVFWELRTREISKLVPGLWFNMGYRAYLNE